MTHEQRQQAVVDLIAAGELQAARDLAAINEDIMRDEIAAYKQATDELTAMLDLADFSRGPLPQLVIGSRLYHSVFAILRRYTHTLKDRGLYEAVVAELLEHTQTSAVIN
jgi:ABC-type uncharacterized transport system ATPase subunit